MEPIDYSKDGLFKSKVSEARQPISIAKGLCEEETDDLELCQRMYGLNDYKCKVQFKERLERCIERSKSSNDF